MPMQWQHVPVVLESGMDSKRDSVAGLRTRLELIENGEFDDKNTLVRSWGTTSQTITDLGVSNPVGSINRLHRFKQQLLIESSAGLHKFLPGAGTSQVFPEVYGSLTAGGSYKTPRGSLLQRPVSGSIRPQTNLFAAGSSFDCAVNPTGGASSVWAWTITEAGYSGIEYQVRAEDSQTVLVQGRLHATGFHRGSPRVIINDSSKAFIYFGYVDEGSNQYEVRCFDINLSTYAAGSEVTVFTSTTAGSDPGLVMFDAVRDAAGPAIYLAALDTNNDVLLKKISDVNGSTVSATQSWTPATTVETITVEWGAQAANLVVLYTRSSNILYGRTWPGSGAVGAEQTVYTAPGGSRLGRVSASDDTVGSLSVVVDASEAAYNLSASPPIFPAGHSIVRGSVNDDLSSPSFTATLGVAGWALGGRISRSSLGTLVPVLILGGTATPSWGIADLGTQELVSGEMAAYLAARTAYGEGGYVQEDWTQYLRLPSCYVVGSTLVFGATRWVSDLQLAAGDNVSSQNIQRCDLNFADALGVVETQGLSLLAGGCPVVVDEQYMAEEGFHNPPQAYTLTAVATGTGEGPFTAGEITWYLVQEWRDAQGNLHQGPPSNSSRVTTTGPLPNINGLGTKFLAPTQKGRPFGVWYRTEAGSAGPAYRAERADGTIITDDSELIQGDPIYTTGASGEELPNEPAPAFRQGCAWQNRVWLAGCDDGRSIFFSKALEEGTATRFNRQLVRRVPADWGRVVGVAPLDNRLLIIAEYAIGSIYGSGPNNLGEQDAYSDPEPLDKSIGGNWAAPLSIIETSDGVWFQSRQGLRLVTRGGAVARGDDGVYMGTEVDGYNDTTLPFTASLRPDKMQVIFSRASRTLVYDQTWRQWSTWTAGSAASHTAGGVWYAATGSTLYARSASATQLNGANFNTTFRTGWVSMAGIAGSKRLRRLQIVMHDPARAAGTQTGTLTIRQNFDGLTAVSTMVITFTPNAAGIAQIEHHFATQYCESVQIEFSFRPTAASSARLRLAALSLEVGMKPGSWRLADTQRF